VRQFAQRQQSGAEISPLGVKSVSSKQNRIANRLEMQVSVPGDSSEQEADRVANSVMNMPARPGVHAKRFESLHGRAAATTDTREIPSSVHGVLKSAGQPLDAEARAFFEPRFGFDFSQVRVHSGASADEAARSVSATAFTVDRDVFFGSGRYSPRSRGGRTLLAHELTHVVQQRNAGTPVLQRSPTFKDCKTKVKGHEDANEIALTQAIKGAGDLTGAAIDRLSGLIEADIEAKKAFEANFGEATDDRVKAVLKVYGEIKKSIDGKTIVCDAKCAQRNTDSVVCANAAPGDTITVCPEFFIDPCKGSQPAILLHEAAHNASAMGNQDKDNKKAKKKSYPPKDGENNAYSYQHFAEDIQNKTFDSKPVMNRPKEIEVKPQK
jgi:hypothetical protein